MEGRRVQNERQEYRQEIEKKARQSGGTGVSSRDRRRAENRVRSRKEWMDNMSEQYAQN